MKGPSDIQGLLDKELSDLADSRVESHVRGLLVDPVVVDRHWDYGAPGQTYPCWTVLRHEASDTAIVYCEFGFGPRSPWGLVYDAGSLPMGMDSAWYPSFAEAYFDSLAATELAIWRVFKEDGGRPEVPVTGESDWKSTWAEIERLRGLHPGVRYHCGHRIGRSERDGGEGKATS